MSSTLITDYLAQGTHAARPTTPNVPSGCTAIYYETDTSNTFAWSGSAWVQVNGGGVTPTSVVQVGTTVGTDGSVTMGTAPTAGNLLIAIVTDFASSIINGTGWNPVTSSAGGADGFGFGWKIAGVSESTTQTPTTATSNGAICIFELAAGNAGVWFVTKDVSSASPSRAFTTSKPNQFCIGIVDCQVASVSPTSVTGMDSHTTVNGGSRSLTYFNVSPVSAGSNSVSATYAASHTSVIAVIVVG